MNNETRISDLTISQFNALVRKTVQESIAEVLLEFSLAAEYEAELVQQAEMNDMIRASLSERIPGYHHPLGPALDD